MLPTLPNVRAPRLVRHPGGVDGPIHAELELDDLGALRIRKLMRETRLRGFFVCIRCVDYVCVDLHDAYVDPPPTLLHADDAIVCTDPESVICKKCATASAKAETERILHQAFLRLGHLIVDHLPHSTLLAIVCGFFSPRTCCFEQGVKLTRWVLRSLCLSHHRWLL